MINRANNFSNVPDKMPPKAYSMPSISIEKVTPAERCREVATKEIDHLGDWSGLELEWAALLLAHRPIASAIRHSYLKNTSFVKLRQLRWQVISFRSAEMRLALEHSLVSLSLTILWQKRNPELFGLITLEAPTFLKIHTIVLFYQQIKRVIINDVAQYTEIMMRYICSRVDHRQENHPDWPLRHPDDPSLPWAPGLSISEVN